MAHNHPLNTDHSQEVNQRRRLVSFLADCIPNHFVAIERLAELLERISNITGYHYIIDREPFQIEFRHVRNKSQEQPRLVVGYHIILYSVSFEDFEGLSQYVIRHINEMKNR